MSFNVFNFFKRGENLWSAFTNGNGVLKMSRWLAVASDDGPFVGHEPNLPVTHGNHGLNGDAHTRL